MELIKDILTYEFLRYSLLSTVLISVLTGFVSPIIVYKRMEFVGDGLAHAIFAGVALAFILNFNIFVGAMFATLLFAFLIYQINQTSQLAESTIIGMLLPVFMSVGIILFSKTNKYTTDVMSYLFGNLLLISKGDIYFLSVIGIITVIVILSKLYEISYWISDEAMAQFYGINTKIIKFVVLLSISLVVVASLKLAGVIVMGAFLVLPGVFSKLRAKSIKNAIFRASIFNFSTSIIGFVLAYYFDIPPGPSIVLTSFSFLLVSMILSR